MAQQLYPKDLGTILLKPAPSEASLPEGVYPYNPGGPQITRPVAPLDTALPQFPQQPQPVQAQAPSPDMSMPGMRPPKDNAELEQRKSTWKDFFSRIAEDPETLATLVVIGNALANPEPGATPVGQFSNAMYMGMQYRSALEQAKALQKQKQEEAAREQERLRMEQEKLGLLKNKDKREDKALEAKTAYMKAQAEALRQKDKKGKQSASSKMPLSKKLAVQGWYDLLKKDALSPPGWVDLDRAYKQLFGVDRNGRIAPPEGWGASGQQASPSPSATEDPILQRLRALREGKK